MHTKKMVSVLAASLAVALAVAQEEEVQEPAAKPAAKAAAGTRFTALPQCKFAEGAAEVLKPAAEAWQAVEEGKFYPLGSSFRTQNRGKLEVAFGPESKAVISGDSAFKLREQAFGGKSRTLELVKGTVELDLADNLPKGAFFVSTAGFMVKNLAGESRYVYEPTGDGEKVTVRCVTGALGIEGRHFDIPVMHAADEIVVRSSHDFLSTCLSGTSGDYIVRLDQGVRAKDQVGDDAQIRQVVEKSVSEWHLSPSTRVVINRSLPAIGERMSVHTMAFDAAGERKSECYFCEGRVEVNSGELVVREKVDGEELAQRAAEATETTEAADAEENSDAEGGDNNSESSATEE